jgi:hypothetical protein
MTLLGRASWNEMKHTGHACMLIGTVQTTRLNRPGDFRVSTLRHTDAESDTKNGMLVSIDPSHRQHLRQSPCLPSTDRRSPTKDASSYMPTDRKDYPSVHSYMAIWRCFSDTQPVLWSRRCGRGGRGCGIRTSDQSILGCDRPELQGAECRKMRRLT